jgi:hypothetical protein
METRYSPRIPVECAVIFAGEAAAGEGRTIDVTLPGCMLETSSHLDLGQYVQLRVFLPDQEHPLEVELAAVRWIEGNRAGLEFIRTSDEEYVRLVRFINDRLPLVDTAESLREAAMPAMAA